MSSRPRIAVVGIALRYPDAETPEDLWRNVLAGRRAFRKLPDERMRSEDYYSPDPSAPDRFYSRKAAVIEGFEFDRVEHRVAGSTFRATDMTHWLALDTAARALKDAGLPDGEGLPRRSTGVIIGNTLTGEFSRANIMRLRWPYVRRTVGAALREQGWDDGRLGGFLDELEGRYKSPFPPIDEDSLAGGLANTIAGRICNHFDLHGGGFTVDGACSSSLLSVATACDALSDGRLDAAVAGGVDLSIDPFEVIGFAKTGALARTVMKVYDKDSNGFWPGEGCGMLVLMREQDAIEQGRRRYAVIAGWGYSSDGRGGITRPEEDGHRLALQRAYASAGFGIETVGYFEGHGTGTAVGDATELRAFSGARRAADPDAAPAAISTVKGNFGHTKAAAGVAGLIKAVLAVRHQIIPPATSHFDPHPELTGPRPALRVPDRAELFPAGAPVRAGVSSMGFGGINAHIVVEHAAGPRRVALGRAVHQLVRSRQDGELLLLDASDTAELRGLAAQLAALAGRLSYAELGDLAATLQRNLSGKRLRAALVASSPEDAEAGFGRLLAALDGGARSVLDPVHGVYLGSAGRAPRIGFLFPGQGAGRRGDGGAVRRRFAPVDEFYSALGLPEGGDQVATEVAQPRIVASSLAGLRLLALLGIEAHGAVGHSLGEITALHWAGAVDEAGALEIATARGRVMADASDGGGTMAGIAAAPDQVVPLLAGTGVVISGYNGPRQTVVSGPQAAVDEVCRAAAREGLSASRIHVSHAFHSEAVAPAATALSGYLADRAFRPLERTMYSTVTGAALPADTDPRRLLTSQVLDPVRFTEAAGALAAESDLLIEVGPGRILSGLAAEIAPTVPAVAMDADSLSLTGLLGTVASAYVLGAAVAHRELFRDRFTRPLPLDKEFSFFASPCESAPEGDFGLDGVSAAVATDPSAAAAANGQQTDAEAETETDSLDLLIRLAAERAELPVASVRADSNPLDELHLSSITVGQIVNEASRRLGIAPPTVTSNFATSTLADLAVLLDELGGAAAVPERGPRRDPAGVGPWVRAFESRLVPTPTAPAALVGRVRTGGRGGWLLHTSAGHPLAEPLHRALQAAGLGDGVLLCLPADCDEGHTALMLAAAREALSLGPGARFVAVGDRRGAAGLAKTLHLESPETATTVVVLSPAARSTAERAEQLAAGIVADVAATSGFSEVHYDDAGARSVPVLRALPTDAPRTVAALDATDVLLITGGGKGITAECALALGRDSGACVALLGRGDPETDPELAANLERLRAAGVVFTYLRADVTSADQVKAAVEQVRRTYGPVTAVLHGAGRNEPRALTDLDEATFRRTLAPKITGLETVLSAIDAADLRLLVTFGSIIGRAGLRGEADYATANDWLTDLTLRYGEAYPHTRVLALEWSVWSGAGMGERLGVLESLIREGIEPIPADQGVALLGRLLADPSTPPAVVVSSRAQGLPTISLERGELPLLRFLDRPRVYYPGIELVVEAELSGDNDLYLADHLLDGDLLFPAVFGMEAMAQAARALTGRTGPPSLHEVEFLRPIVAQPRGTTIRIAVLARADGAVEAVIRSAETDFQADHFRATLRYDAPRPAQVGALPGIVRALPVDPARELYGPVLFQGGRFQRLTGYRQLSATACVARIAPAERSAWFPDFAPAELVLGDPGSRDVYMHAIQCNVPDATLLPAGVEAIYPADAVAAAGGGSLTLHAVERSRTGDTYVYDLDVLAADGSLVEAWRGLKLQAVRKLDGAGPWLPLLLGPYLERRTPEAVGAALRCVVLPDGAEPGGGRTARRRATNEALGWALGRETAVRYRPDGRPEVDGAEVSASHGAGVTFAVAAERRAACDVEPAVRRSEREWGDLLGTEGFALARLLAGQTGEEPAVAATRVWGAIECLRKAGHVLADQLAADAPGPDGWVYLRCGDARIATFATRLLGRPEAVVFTLLSEEEQRS
jgi:enediyne polyketide synthase